MKAIAIVPGRPETAGVVELGLRREGIRVELRCGVIEAFEGTQRGQFDPFVRARRRSFPFEEGGQLSLQLDIAFALPHPLG